jgi:hypothetical protein
MAITSGIAANPRPVEKFTVEEYGDYTITRVPAFAGSCAWFDICAKADGTEVGAVTDRALVDPFLNWLATAA